MLSFLWGVATLWGLYRWKMWAVCSLFVLLVAQTIVEIIELDPSGHARVTWAIRVTGSVLWIAAVGRQWHYFA